MRAPLENPASVTRITDGACAARYDPFAVNEWTTAMQTFLASAANLKPVRRAGPNARSSHDAVLLGRIACGDTAAMRMLFANHQVAVYRFVLRRLRDTTLAEDVTSEVFLDVWRHAGRFEGRSAVSTWILAIARHKAFSARPRLDHIQLEDDMVETNGNVVDDPGAMLQARDRSIVLRKCITRLSAEHREIIDLVYYQEQTVESVATILGIPRNTAKTRVFYARKRLSDELRKSGVDSTWI
jgi:RNA polymerase sigma-70 factor (ECF subfamily)